eukprot:1795647-Rhodomonas_salina.1
MSIFGTIPQDTSGWLRLTHFNATNLTPAPAQAKQIQHDGIHACITAGFALHNTYRSRIEALAPTPPPRARASASTALALAPPQLSDSRSLNSSLSPLSV